MPTRNIFNNFCQMPNYIQISFKFNANIIKIFKEILVCMGQQTNYAYLFKETTLQEPESIV